MGIGYLHGKGIVHRDLKSLNVLLKTPILDEQSEPHLKLCDFGMSTLSRFCRREPRGKAVYSAPEMHLDIVYDAFLTDAFALGVVLYVMATAIRGMGKVLAWAIALLSIMLMSEALFLTQVLNMVYFTDSTAATLSPERLVVYHQMFEFFGTFTRCALTMFELTLANWPPATRLLAEEVSEWFMVFCLVHKLTIGFAVIGVINGVFMQETFNVASTDDDIMVRRKRQAASTHTRKMVSLFSHLDVSEDGELDFEEFQAITKSPWVQAWLSSMELDTDDMEFLFSLLDEDGNGTINAQEMVTGVRKLKGTAKEIDIQRILHQVRLLTNTADEDARHLARKVATQPRQFPVSPSSGGAAVLLHV